MILIGPLEWNGLASRLPGGSSNRAIAPHGDVHADGVKTDWPCAEAPPNRLSPTLALCSVLGACLLAVGHSLGVKHAANDMVADAWQIAHAPAANKDN
jgi:hypothetical protein